MCFAGKKHSEESKRKISEWSKKRKHSEDTKKKMSDSAKGRKFSEEHKKKLSLAHLGKKMPEAIKIKIGLANKGKKKPEFSDEHRKNLSLAKKKEYKNGKTSGFIKIWKDDPDFMRGKNNPNWIEDRDKLKKSEKKHLDGRYREWMKSVKDRDGWKCKINNKDCGGRLESHHILSWMLYPELRYEINNGITLCCKHHPRKRTEEKALINYFKSLINI